MHFYAEMILQWLSAADAESLMTSTWSGSALFANVIGRREAYTGDGFIHEPRIHVWRRVPSWDPINWCRHSNVVRMEYEMSTTVRNGNRLIGTNSGIGLNPQWPYGKLVNKPDCVKSKTLFTCSDVVVGQRFRIPTAAQLWRLLRFIFRLIAFENCPIYCA